MQINNNKIFRCDLLLFAFFIYNINHVLSDDSFKTLALAHA